MKCIPCGLNPIKHHIIIGIPQQSIPNIQKPIIPNASNTQKKVKFSTPTKKKKSDGEKKPALGIEGAHNSVVLSNIGGVVSFQVFLCLSCVVTSSNCTEKSPSMT